MRAEHSTEAAATREQWTLLSAADRKRLLTTDPAALPGRIMLLNRLPRYHNMLDALFLVFHIADLRRERTLRATGPKPDKR